jgi:hypothetical protein
MLGMKTTNKVHVYPNIISKISNMINKINQRNPHMTQQQEPVARSPGDPKQKQDRAKSEHGQVNH